MGEPQLRVRVGRDVATVTPWVEHVDESETCEVLVTRGGTTWQVATLVWTLSGAMHCVTPRRWMAIDAWLRAVSETLPALTESAPRSAAAREAVRQMREAHSSPEGSDG